VSGRHLTFGRVIRGLRHRFHFSGTYEAYIRIGEDEGGGYRVEVLPADYDLRLLSSAPKGSYFIWWDGEDSGERLLSMIEPLQGVHKPSEPCAFVVGERGELLRHVNDKEQRR